MSKPTEKMIDLMRKLAKGFNIEVPEEAMEDFDKAKEFIEEYKDKPFPPRKPSEKALDYARSIAEKREVEIPEDALENSKILSEWIDNNK